MYIHIQFQSFKHVIGTRILMSKYISTTGRRFQTRTAKTRRIDRFISPNLLFQLGSSPKQQLYNKRTSVESQPSYISVVPSFEKRHCGICRCGCQYSYVYKCIYIIYIYIYTYIYTYIILHSCIQININMLLYSFLNIHISVSSSFIFL